MVEVEGRLRREMCLVGAVLYASAATLVLISVVVPHWDGLWTEAILAIVAAGYLAALAHVAVARLTIPPLWFLAGSTALGSVLVGIGVYAGGQAAAPAYGVFFVYVVAFSAYYFPVWLTIVEVVVAGGVYGVVLAVLGHGAAPAEWVVLIGAAVVAGGVIGGLGQRARTLYQREQETADRLREVDEMKTTFLQAVSHELRTPLTAVTGYADVLRKHGGELTPERTDMLLDRLHGNARRLDGLLGDLLDVDRLSRGILRLSREPTDVGAAARDVGDHLEGVDRTIRVRTEPVVVPADRPKVERIIENLIVNAVKHTPPGTPVEVTVEAVAGGALITVDDRGPGVPDGRRGGIWVV
jgi:signal transduction histidine kinase